MNIKLAEINTKELIKLEDFLQNNEIDENTFFELTKLINFSFSVEECSRLLSHHICESIDSYTQQSQRYVKMGPNAFVTPKEIKNLGEEIEKEYCELNKEIFEFYNKMTKIKEGFAGRKAQESDYVYGIKIEDGRYLLPLSTTTNVFMTMNFSQIIRFYKTMKRIRINESEEILEKLDESINQALNKKDSTVVKKIRELTNSTVEEKEAIAFFDEYFSKITQENDCIFINSFEQPILSLIHI